MKIHISKFWQTIGFGQPNGMGGLFYNVGFNWHASAWWPIYSKTWHDGYWTIVHIGPFHFSKGPYGD